MLVVHPKRLVVLVDRLLDRIQSVLDVAQILNALALKDHVEVVELLGLLRPPLDVTFDENPHLKEGRVDVLQVVERSGGVDRASIRHEELNI